MSIEDIKQCKIHGKYVNNPIDKLQGCMGCRVAYRYMIKVENEFLTEYKYAVPGTNYCVSAIDEKERETLIITECSDLCCDECNSHRRICKHSSLLEKKMNHLEKIKYEKIKIKTIEENGYGIEVQYKHQLD